ncbi:PREDICTED: uncharacterized protein LOC106323779 [Brassica oleracea var. oleracea]|uniref:uncharacterized protein LOC106323779 n=1 Tax=Brassica oleracea var. oleracea TaxID=109376 RepID=UPI0006A6CFA9|nr:PREDICTED: uncharacterized protein LOC106323779 [Brassica oleracea var. oleracea]
MVLIYVNSSEWVSSCNEEWSFMVDTSRRGRMVTLETTTPLEKLKRIVCEDYGVDYIVLNTEFSYSMVRAEGIDESTYFMINQCEGRHSCAPTKKRKFGKTASARTIGTLIQHRFGDANDGPKENEIIQFMRLEHSCEITYWHAWEAREFAIAAATGIPDRSYVKIPAYLHMIKEANPGTHTHYETNEKGRLMHLFMSVGQSVRGFYNAMRRVIVVDGTFLKNKYKGFLLVATAVDGNSNLYPIAFGVVDSKNDDSWGGSSDS